MHIKGIKNINTLKELDEAVELLENPYSFEEYCNACDYFNTDKCPFKNKVSYMTKWKQIGCNNFWD